MSVLVSCFFLIYVIYDVVLGGRWLRQMQVVSSSLKTPLNLLFFERKNLAQKKLNQIERPKRTGDRRRGTVRLHSTINHSIGRNNERTTRHFAETGRERRLAAMNEDWIGDRTAGRAPTDLSSSSCLQ